MAKRAKPEEIKVKLLNHRPSIGMSGTRLVLTAVEELQQRSGRCALCAMCIGGGQGNASVAEKV